MLPLPFNKPTSNARRRRKKNIISSVGHFISWVVETILFSPMAVLHGTMTPNSSVGFYYWMFIILIPCINFIVFPTGMFKKVGFTSACSNRGVRDHKT